MLSIQQRKTVLIGISLIAVVAMFFVHRIAQDPAYHLFADRRTLSGIPHFWNVVSNLPFVLIGLYGLSRLPRLAEERSRNAYIALCGGVLLVGLGSAYYHYAPSTPSLLWDRLPMTIAFMALFSLLLEERVLSHAKPRSLIPLLLLGLFSAVYWAWAESRGMGDLRPYALVQFLPMLLIPLILFFFSSRYLDSRLLCYALFFYLLAKVLEYFDAPIFSALDVISGHSIKHLSAAIAVWFIVRAVKVK